MTDISTASAAVISKVQESTLEMTATDAVETGSWGCLVAQW